MDVCLVIIPNRGCTSKQSLRSMSQMRACTSSGILKLVTDGDCVVKYHSLLLDSIV